MDYFFIGVLVGVCLYFAYNVYRVYQLRQVGKELEQRTIEMLDKAVFLQVTETDGMLYAYNMLDNSFVAQGPDMDTLGKNFTARFPSKVGVVIKEEDENTVTV